jgi:anti-sigma factor RsiW
MNCHESQHLLHAYEDGELDLVKSLDIEQHLGECQRCLREHKNTRAVSALLKDEELYLRAPEHLRNRVTNALRQSVKPEARGRVWSFNWLLTGLAAATALLVLSFSLAIQFNRPSRESQVVQELAANHVRSQMANHITDVVSSDQHTVKPWFAGRLDFSPLVKDLTDQGFTLTGGRLEYLDGHNAAALVYLRNKHIINLFIWPVADAANAAPSRVQGYQGYHFIRWSDGGMSFWVVSELNETELMEFAQAFAGK